MLRAEMEIKVGCYYLWVWYVMIDIQYKLFFYDDTMIYNYNNNKINNK